MRHYLLIVGGLFLTSVSFAVSRVGGGTLGSVADGYTMSVPIPFQLTFKGPDQSFRLQGPPQIVLQGAGFFQSSDIGVFSLAHDIPELQGETNRGRVVQYLILRGWRPSTSAAADPCLQIFEYSRSTGLTTVVAWGGGHGLVLTGQNVSLVEKGIADLVSTLRLTPGACAWK